MASHLAVPPTATGRVLDGPTDAVVAWAATHRVDAAEFWVKHRRALVRLSLALLDLLVLADIVFVVMLLVLNGRHGEAMVIAAGSVLIPAFWWAWHKMGDES